MHKSEFHSDRSRSIQKLFKGSLVLIIYLLISVIIQICHCEKQNVELPTKIFNIDKSDEEIPIITLSKLCPQFQSISLILDSGSQQLALFDNQCQSCINTFSACPHVKTLNNQTLISYLLIKFKGDFSYLSLTEQFRIRFFCVLETDQNINSLVTNGVFGIKSKFKQFNGLIATQGNGLKIWRKIVHKIYDHQLKLNRIDQTKFQTLSYSLLYSPYHTQLILGSLPDYLKQGYITQYSLKQKIYVRQLYFSSDKKQNLIQNSNKQYQVHFDTGSSVIVLPQNIFQKLSQLMRQKISNQCQIVKFLIECPKSQIYKFIQADFKLRISLLQKKEYQDRQYQISLQQLVQNNIQENSRQFSFKIYGHKTQNENQKQIIILGVPFFKQYLVQFDIPYEINQRTNIFDSKVDIFKRQKQQEYLLKIYDHQFKLEQQTLSSYDHMIKKQTKNIKILLFAYLFLVIGASYLVITIYWWTHRFIYGKKSIV